MDLCAQIQAPNKRNWPEMEARFADPAGRASWEEMQRRRDGKCARFKRQAVQKHTTVSMEWKVDFKPVPVAELKRRYPKVDLSAVPGLRFEKIKNEKNEEVVVALFKVGDDRVTISCKTEAAYIEHVMRPESQLRAGQGEEHWQELLQQTLRSRPRSDGIAEHELAALLGQAAPTKDSVRGSASSSRAEERGSHTAIVAHDDDYSQYGRKADEAEGEEEDAGERAPSPASTTASRRKSGAKRPSANQDGEGSKKPRKGTPPPAKAAEALTVENILRGIIDKPKVLIYHRQMSLPTLKKTESEIAIRVEEALLEALRSASVLVPLELPRIQESDLRPALDKVLGHIGIKRLPVETVLGLVRRAALIQLGKPREVWSSVWPWAGPADATPAPFDPYRPRLQDAVQWPSVELPSLAEFAAKTIVEDCLASLMARKTVDEIGELAELARGMRCPDENSATCGRDLKTLLVGVWALVQPTAIDSTQIQALLAVKTGSSALIKALKPVLQDVYWADRMKEVWPRAAAESTAAPLMDRARSDLLSSDSADIERGWSTLAGKLQQWTDLLRPGATQHVLCAAVTSLQAAVADVTSAEATTENQQRAERWRARAAWLRQATECSSLEDWLQASSATIQLKQGMLLLPSLAESDITPEALAHALSTFEACRGLKCSGDDASSTAAAVESLEHLDLTETIARLAGAMIATLPEETSSTLEPARWQKTLLGFKLAQIAADLPAADSAHITEEIKANVALVLAEWSSAPEDVRGDAEPALAAASALQEWQETLATRARDALHSTAVAAVVALEAEAGGTGDSESWKARVDADSAWDVVEREALHHLLPANCPPRHKTLEERYGKAKAAVDAMGHEDGRQPDLRSRLDNAAVIARATSTESFLMDIILHGQPDRQAAKIKKRMEQMSKPPEVTPDSLLPQIWSRTLAIAIDSSAQA